MSRCCKALSHSMFLCNKTIFLEMCCCSLCTYLAFRICLVSYLVIEAWAFQQNLHQSSLLFSLSWCFWAVIDTLPLATQTDFFHKRHTNTGKAAPDSYQSSQNKTWTTTLHDETWPPYTISSMIKKDTLSRWKLIWKQKEQLKKPWFPEFFTQLMQ